MPTYAQTQETKIWPKAETGSYKVVLQSIKVVDDKPFGAGPESDELVQKFRWVYQTVDVTDEDTGELYTFSEKTGMFYGGDKAKLTARVNAMFGGPVDPELFAKLDLESLVGCTFTALVELKQGDKGAYNVITSVGRSRKNPLDIHAFLNGHSAPAQQPQTGKQQSSQGFHNAQQQNKGNVTSEFGEPDDMGDPFEDN